MYSISKYTRQQGDTSIFSRMRANTKPELMKGVNPEAADSAHRIWVNQLKQCITASPLHQGERMGGVKGRNGK